MPPPTRDAYSGGDGDDDDDQADKLANDEQIAACPDCLDRLGACGRLRDASAFPPARLHHRGEQYPQSFRVGISDQSR